MRRERVRIHPYVDRAIATQLAAHSAATGVAASAVVQAALSEYLDHKGHVTLLLQRLGRLGRAGARTHRDLQLLMDAFGVWVRLWFAHTPRVDDDAKDFARRTAEARYVQFVDHVGETFANGHRFLDDFPREVAAEEAAAPKPSAATVPTPPPLGGR
jgi:hypothetical protein